MMIKRYLGETALSGMVEVVELIASERPIARLRETWFHPQGGGQKGDRGVIGSVEVVDVRFGPEKTIDHFVSTLDGLEVGQTYPFTVDAQWRRLNSRNHSAGHLLSGVCERLFPGIEPEAGHHWPGEARVDFRGSGLERIIENAAMIEQAVNEDIQKDIPIGIIGDPYADRRCSVGDYTPIACGGTHASSTAELGEFKIRSAKRKGNLVRVGYELSA